MVTNVANRTSVPGEAGSAETPLGQLLREFRWRLRMNQREAATALGVGATTLASYELGYDVKTRLPVNPREATLQMLARRMWEMAGEHGAPYQGVSDDLYKRLMVAAGKAEPERVEAGELHGAREDFLFSSGSPSHSSQQIDIPPEMFELDEPPDEEEIAIVRMLGIAESGPYALKPGVQFWTEPQVARLRRLRFTADNWRDAKASKSKKGRS